MATSNLDRKEVLKILFPSPDSYLFITGLAGSARDTAYLTQDGKNVFTMAGTMGAAIPMGLGVALCAPDKSVIVVSGDGEILMNLGALATVATMAPSNLSIICIDNECHGETGGQPSHTSKLTDLAKIALGAGIPSVISISNKADLIKGKHLLDASPGPTFVIVKVNSAAPAIFKRNLDPSECRVRFRRKFIK